MYLLRIEVKCFSRILCLPKLLEFPHISSLLSFLILPHHELSCTIIFCNHLSLSYAHYIFLYLFPPLSLYLSFCIVSWRVWLLPSFDWWANSSMLTPVPTFWWTLNPTFPLLPLFSNSTLLSIRCTSSYPLSLFVFFLGFLHILFLVSFFYLHRLTLPYHRSTYTQFLPCTYSIVRN